MNELINKLLLTEVSVVDIVLTSIIKNHGITLTYFNQHSFNLAFTNTKFRKLLSNDFFVYVDGIAIYLLLKYVTKVNVQKFNASDFNKKIIDLLEEKECKYLIIGGSFTNEVINKFKFSNKFLCGHFRGYNIDEKELVSSILKENPDVIFVGMGSPLQEELSFKLSQNFENKIIICTGNFFEFYFGSIKRAPRFIHNSGFEWIFRIFTEPRRLWKRYLIGIPLFIFRIIIFKFSLKKESN